MNIKKELFDIATLLREANFQEIVRHEVKNVLGKTAMVVGGKYAEKHAADTSNYDVVIIHKAGEKDVELITRRIKASLPDVEVKKLNGLVDGVIGIRQTRRVR